MKNVVLIGASGFVGTAILNELLNRGHKVTAIVRDPAKVTASNPNLKVIQADVTDTDVLIEASKGKDAVISAYNPGLLHTIYYQRIVFQRFFVYIGILPAGVISADDGVFTFTGLNQNIGIGYICLNDFQVRIAEQRP